MKVFISVLCIFSTSTWATSINLVTEGSVDLSNTSLHGHRTHILPPELERPVRLRVTYTFTRGIRGKLNKVFVPAREDCGDFYCNEIPARWEVTISFQDPNLKRQWELIDANTGQSLGIVRDQLAIQVSATFNSDVQSLSEGQYPLQLITIGSTQPDNPMHVQFGLLHFDPHRYVLSFQRSYSSGLRRLEGAHIQIRARGHDIYELESIFFNPKALRSSFATEGPTLAVNYQTQGPYYGVGGVGNLYNSYLEQLVGFFKISE